MRQHERPRRDVDSAQIAFRIKALTWSLFALVIGFGFGALVSGFTDAPALLVIGGCGLAFFAVSYIGSLWFGDRIAGVAGSLYFSSGRSTPGKRQYSLADALLARGEVDDAVAELERAAAVWPDDAEPCLRLARVLRDRCGRHEDAVRQFRAAIARSQEPGLEVAALREIIAIYTDKLDTPRRALPDLARLSQRFAGTPAGDWARRELADIKSRMDRDA